MDNLWITCPGAARPRDKLQTPKLQRMAKNLDKIETPPLNFHRARREFPIRDKEWQKSAIKYLARGLDRRLNRHYIRCINLKDGRKRKKNGAFTRYFNTGNSEGCSRSCSHLDPGAAAGLMQTPKLLEIPNIR